MNVWCYVYDKATGELYSSTPNGEAVAPDDVLEAAGRDVLRNQPPQDDTHVWDPITRAIHEVAPPYRARNILAYQFIAAFTDDEHAAIMASSNKTVGKLLHMLSLAPELDMNGTTIAQGLALLVGLGLLTQGRADAIKLTAGT